MGRRIVDGAEKVKILVEEIPVRIGTYSIGGFSAHADQTELLTWDRQTGNPTTTFLVHGEKDVMPIFAKNFKNTQIEISELHLRYNLENWF